MRTFRKLGFETEETKNITNALNKLLANYHVHYQKLRNYHWNVKGSDFFDLHEQFEQEYNQVKLNIDAIAERIRIFGKTPLSTLSEYLDVSEIKETHKPLSSMEMVSEILDDFETLLSLMIDVTDAAIKIGDTGTDHMMTGFVQRMEKRHWMLTAFTKEEQKELANS